MLKAIDRCENENRILIHKTPKNRWQGNEKFPRSSRFRGVSKNGLKWQVRNMAILIFNYLPLGSSFFKLQKKVSRANKERESSSPYLWQAGYHDQWSKGKNKLRLLKAIVEETSAERWRRSWGWPFRWRGLVEMSGSTNRLLSSYGWINLLSVFSALLVFAACRLFVLNPFRGYDTCSIFTVI